MKKRILLLAAFAAGALGMRAQTPEDGIYFLRTDDNLYLSRNGAKMAIVEEWGVPVEILTAGGSSSVRYADSHYLCAASNGWDMYTDVTQKQENSTWYFTQSANGKYTLQSQKNTKAWVKRDNLGSALYYDGTTGIVEWTLETLEEHKATLKTKIDGLAQKAANAAEVEATTEAELEDAVLDMMSGYIIKPSAVTSTAEQWQGTGNILNRTINVTTAGLYKFTIQAFNRMAAHAVVNDLHSKGADFPPVLVYFAGVKKPIMSLFDEENTTNYGNCVEYNDFWYPDGQDGAKAAFADGKYVNTIWVYLEPGEYTYGIENIGNPEAQGHWTCYTENSVSLTLYTKKTDNVTNVELNQTALNLTTAENTAQLTATVGGEGASQVVIWTTKDATVATVSNDGLVTGVAPGTTTIRATAFGHEDVYAEATVTTTYAESTMPESYYVNEDAKRTIYTLDTENLIKNGSFEYGNPFFGWTSNFTDELLPANFGTATEDGETYLVSKGHTGSEGAASISKVWNIEEGKTYVFSYRVKGLNSQTGLMDYLRTSLTNAEKEETSILSPYPTLIKDEWTTVQYTFTNSEGYKYLQVRFRWLGENVSLGLDNFYLSEITDTKEVGNVDYAKAAIPTMNVGYDAFQYSQDAVDETNALVQDEATVEDVENAVKALQVLNQPKEGQLFNVINVSANYDHANKALTFKAAKEADFTVEKFTTMGWIEAAGSIYPQAVKFTPVEGTLNEYTMSYIRADGQNVYIATAKGAGFGSDVKTIRPTTDASKALKLRVEASTKENVWYLWNTENEKRIGGNGKSDNGLFTGEANGLSYYDMKLAEAAETNYTLTVDVNNQYGTLIVPFDTEVPAGATVYTITGHEGATLTLTAAETIKANTPYVVEATEGINEELSGLGKAYTDDTYGEGWLTGAYTEQSAPTDSYVLQNQDDVVAFYKVSAADPVMVPAYKAYLTVPAEAAGRNAFFFDGEATAIHNVVNAFTSGNVEVYNASGVRQNGLQKGLNIIRTKDGSTHKVMVK